MHKFEEDLEAGRVKAYSGSTVIQDANGQLLVAVFSHHPKPDLLDTHGQIKQRRQRKNERVRLSYCIYPLLMYVIDEWHEGTDEGTSSHSR
jgi:hypothetical protein